METCKLCGKEYKAITHTHLKKAHGIASVEEYQVMTEGMEKDLEVPTPVVVEEKKGAFQTVRDALLSIWSK